ncbi:MAG: cysteine synthase A [Treponema sp. CETP13]|nr:MAG: cysteine synthase A [Treponema sp. CETP13]
MTIVKHVNELIGNTPLLELSNFEESHKLPVRLCAKLEKMNPSGSVKDRAALFIIEKALKEGKLVAGTQKNPSKSVLIEETSGNTGIGLASIAASLNIRCICVMPENMSEERKQILKAYGAEVVLTPAQNGMQGAVDKVNELVTQIPGSFVASQFDNPANPEAHYKTTGPEIWEQSEGKIDIFISGIGTGGTLSGTGKYLKEQNPKIQIIGVEPAESPIITKGTTGPHKIQGIGANFIPDNYIAKYVDEILRCPSEKAFEYGKEIPKEGILCGISSGAALWAAEQVAFRPENAGKLIVCVFPDDGARYLSTNLFT